MNDTKKIRLSPSATIKEALRIIDSGAMKFAIVTDESGRLLGAVTDGDIRRAILNGDTLESTIENIYSKDPVYAHKGDSRESIANICMSKGIYQIPIVDDDNIVVSVAVLDELLKPVKYPNKVVLMVGGLGTRLRPLTESVPKPMLHVGGKPILQTIVEKFAGYGFTDIIMCIGYKSHVIQDYFGDGGRFGVNIEYVIEEKRMGTAGALSLLKNIPEEPFFVMNGDLLTNVNFESFLEYHMSHGSAATMAVREYDLQVPYGVVNVRDGKIISIEEKPVHSFFVNAGIYVLNPECIEYVPEDQFFDMPNLFEKLSQKDMNVLSFPLREYWMDIGHMEEYERANREYFEVFDNA